MDEIESSEQIFNAGTILIPFKWYYHFKSQKPFWDSLAEKNLVVSSP